MKKKMQLIEINKKSDKVSSVFVLIFISGTPRPTKDVNAISKFLGTWVFAKDQIPYYFQCTVLLLNDCLLFLRTRAI